MLITQESKYVHYTEVLIKQASTGVNITHMSKVAGCTSEYRCQLHRWVKMWITNVYTGFNNNTLKYRCECYIGEYRCYYTCEYRCECCTGE